MISSMPISASIDTTRTVQLNAGDDKFTVYQITVRNAFNQVIRIVDRRYREFENLHARLATFISLPNMPRKVLLHRRSSKLVEQRRQLLDIYLNEVIRRCYQQSIMPDELTRFLQISSSDGELLSTQKQDQANDDETDDQEKNYTLQHNPSISVVDIRPWNSDFQEMLPDSVLNGLMESMYTM